MKPLSVIIIGLLLSVYAFAQGQIDHIKNASYMKDASKINCTDADKDNLSEVICANLKYQKSDSLLMDVYTRLLHQKGTDSARNYIIELQKEWRKFRDKHCLIAWNSYGEGS